MRSADPRRSPPRRLAAALLLAAASAGLWACARPPEPPLEVTAAAPVLRLVAGHAGGSDAELGVPVRLRLWLALPAAQHREAWTAASSADPGPVPEAGAPLPLAFLFGGGDPFAPLTEVEGLRVVPVDRGAAFERADTLYWTRGFDLTWLRLGSRTLPELTLAGPRLSTEAMTFEVRGLLGEAPSFEPVLPDDLVVDPPPAPPWPWILGGLGLAAAVAVGLVLRRRLRPRMRPIDAGPLRSPAERARARLAELERDLDQGLLQGEPFVREVGAVLRFYLQDGLGLPSRARTTEEVLRGLDPERHRTAELRVFLDGYLHQCDLVKFAAQGADVALCRDLLTRTRGFVDDQDRRRAAAAEAGAAPTGGGGAHG